MNFILGYFMWTVLRDWPDTELKMFDFAPDEISCKHLLKTGLEPQTSPKYGKWVVMVVVKWVSDASGHAPLCTEMITYIFYKKTIFCDKQQSLP